MTHRCNKRPNPSPVSVHPPSAVTPPVSVPITSPAVMTPPPPKAQKVDCHQCGKPVRSDGMKRHIASQHTENKGVSKINPKHYLDGICINSSAGIFLVREHWKGVISPVHVQKLTSTTISQIVHCSAKSCEVVRVAALRSELSSYECEHLLSIQYIRGCSSNQLFNKYSRQFGE